MPEKETIFTVCGFEIEPLEKSVYLKKLGEYLKAGYPPTITTKDIKLASKLEDQINNNEDGQEKEEIEPVDGGDTGTTPLHRICERLPQSPSDEQLEIATEMIDLLLQYGGNWLMTDDNNETAGCIALRRKLPSHVYDRFVAAGVRSEVMMHKMAELGMGGDDNDNDEEADLKGDTAADQEAYLKADLEYTDTSLITRDQNDGVMMAWEEPIMKKSAELLLSTREEGEGGIVLNVGFGMGIIDTILQSQHPKHHYISEAHPEVLAKMKKDGWYDRRDVTVLEGRWQDTVPKLISQGIYFDGIYYDTFSEHYHDLIDFCDNVVGLLSPSGIFSYFNGLGADRQICYDVYCQVAEMEMSEYGLQVEFEPLSIQDDSGQNIRHKYWALSNYQLPIVRFHQM